MKHLIIISCLLLISITGSSQTICKPPVYSFNSMTNVSGTGGVGSIYRFSNSLTGLNTFVIITKAQNASITNSNMDITGNFALAWQPTITFTNSRNAGDSSYVEFTVKFIDAGSGASQNSINNNMMGQACMAMTIVDCDGPGGTNSYREMVKVSQSATPVGIANSTIGVSQDSKWISMISGVNQFSSIDTSNYGAMAQIEFPQNTKEFTLRVGAVGAVTANLDRQFSFYFKSFTGLNFVLPVTLINFDSKLVNNKDVELNWVTASEQDADRFEIHRSFDGENYMHVGNVPASGTSQEAKSYQFTDEKAVVDFHPHLFYKLKMVETNGTYEWSNIVKVGVTKVPGSDIVTVTPNPSNHFINLNFSESGHSDIQLEIMDAYGKCIQKIDQPEVVNGQMVRLDISTLANGLYFIRFNDNEGGESTTVRFVKD